MSSISILFMKFISYFLREKGRKRNKAIDTLGSYLTLGQQVMFIYMVSLHASIKRPTSRAELAHAKPFQVVPSKLSSQSSPIWVELQALSSKLSRLSSLIQAAQVAGSQAARAL